MRVVLDTKTVVSALLFSDGRLSWLRRAWQGGLICPLVNRETVDELIRVLAYLKFQLEPAGIEALLADFIPFAEVVKRAPAEGLPISRDPDDQVFLELADGGAAEVLVTGDQALLDLGEKVSFKILNPRQFRKTAPRLNP